MSVNRVILVGRLGADPEKRAFPNGGSICNLRLATTESWKDKGTGERKERTEWHRVVLRNKLGEIAQQYLKKGSQIYIEGRIQTRKWQDSEGNNRYSTEVVGNEMTMLDSKGDKPEDYRGHTGSNQENPTAAPQPSSPQAGPDYDQGGGYYDDDSIPF